MPRSKRLRTIFYEEINRLIVEGLERPGWSA